MSGTEFALPSEAKALSTTQLPPPFAHPPRREENPSPPFAGCKVVTAEAEGAPSISNKHSRAQAATWPNWPAGPPARVGPRIGLAPASRMKSDSERLGATRSDSDRLATASRMWTEYIYGDAVIVPSRI